MTNETYGLIQDALEDSFYHREEGLIISYSLQEKTCLRI